jgi:REP element-mobilizing transposase RayT
MPTPEQYKAPFCPVAYYHIVCKCIDGLKLFIDEKDYLVFKERFKRFTSCFFEVWSYNLLPNHTHHIIKTKSVKIITQHLSALQKEERTKAMLLFLKDDQNEILFDQMIERHMNSFLVSYANYCNNRRGRKGGIFQKPFKRIKIDDDIHLQQAIIYTNANAQKHKLISDFKKHPYSSYAAIIYEDDFFVETRNVINFFGSKESFIKIHKEQVDYYYKNNWPSSKLE